MDEQLKDIAGNEEPARDDARKEVIEADKHYSFSEYSSSTNSGSMLMSIFWIVAAMAVTGVVYYYMNRPAPVAQQTPKREAPQKEEIIQETKPVDSAPELPAASTQTSPIHLEISTTDEAWLSVTADGKSQFVGVMKPDEKKTVDASEKIKIVSGNGGAVQLIWNGKPFEEMGPKGQVRVVEITPEGAHVVSHVVPRTPKPALEP